MIATADSALGQVSSLLNDIRGLVSEAANTGAMSQEQIAANQLQIDSSLEAIDRIAQVTQFQGRRLLDGSLDFLTEDVDSTVLTGVRIDQANFGTLDQIDVTIEVVTQATQAELTHTTTAGTITGDVVLEIGGKNGFEAFSFADGSSISDIAQSINLVFDGSTRPYRLSLSSAASGSAGAVVVDASELGIECREIAAARDALLALGEANSAGANVLIASRSNVFDEVIAGVRLEIHGASANPVTIAVANFDIDLTANMHAFVENYNRFRESLLEYTKYDAETDTRAVLTGDATALRLDTELSYWLSGRFRGAGSIESLAELGVSMNEDGTLSFDAAAVKARFAEDADAVKRFFTDETSGLSAKFHGLSQRLSGVDDSLLTSRYETLTRQIEDSEDRIASMDKQLETRRERLMQKFSQMELAIAKLQANMSFLDSIKPIRIRSNSDE